MTGPFDPGEDVIVWRKRGGYKGIVLQASGQGVARFYRIRYASGHTVTVDARLVTAPGAMPPKGL